MGELISGKEALIALANEREVETKKKDEITWSSIGFFAVNVFKDERWEFRLKPRTVNLNGIDVPAPFLPEEREIFYHISPEYEKGYSKSMAHERNETTWQQFGAYRTEDEIKQVVAALRSIFK